jgi:hypothetical protein
MTFTPSSFWTAALGRDFQFTIHAKNKKKYINQNKKLEHKGRRQTRNENTT